MAKSSTLWNLADAAIEKIRASRVDLGSSRDRPAGKAASLALILVAAVTTQPTYAQNDTSDPALEEVVVTGIRGSLQRAQDIKQDSDTLVEVVTLEDLGKFSDENIADILQRIPGVQIERNDSGINGDRVSIRGLGPAFVTTTVNGRSPLSVGNEGIEQQRSFNFDVLPAEVISGIVVHKMPSAELITNGLAGGVEIQTLKPLETSLAGDNNYFGVVNVIASDDDQTDSTEPRVSWIVGGKNQDETFGAYFGGTWSEVETRVDEVFVRAVFRDLQVDDDNDGVADRTEPNVLAHNQLTFNPIKGERKRSAFTLGAQWRPTSNLEIAADYLFSNYEIPTRRDTFDFTSTQLAGVVPASAITVGNGHVLTVDGAQAPGFGADFLDLKFDNLSDNMIGGINVKYSSDDDWTLAFDASFSDIDFFQDLRSSPIFIPGAGFDQSAIFYDVVGNGEVPHITTGGDFADINNWAPLGVFLREFDSDQENTAFRVDFEKPLNDNLTLKVGGRYSDTEVDFRAASTFFGGLDPVAAAASITGVVNFPLDVGLNQWPRTDFDVAASLIPEILTRTATDDGMFDGDLFSAATSTPDGFSLDAGNTFVVEEQTTALYVQVDFNTEIGANSLPVRGNFGLRALRTETTGQAFSGVRVTDATSDVTTGLIPTTGSNDDWEYLPSFNAVLDVRDDLSLRFGVGKVLAQPEYTDLAPSGNVAFHLPGSILHVPGANPTGEFGNPELKPMTAWTYDFSVEYFREDGGAYYASIFYKDVKDFISKVPVQDVTIPGQGAQLFDVSRPTNISDGNAYGLELGLNQPLFDHFGIQANYTYVESEFDDEAAVQGVGVGFPGASQNNFNFIGYYERDRYAARIAYVYRDEFLNNLAGGFDRAAISGFTESYGQLNARVSVDVTDNFEVSLSGTNLTNEDRRNYSLASTNFRDFITRSRIISLGVRAAF